MNDNLDDHKHWQTISCVEKLTWEKLIWDFKPFNQPSCPAARASF